MLGAQHRGMTRHLRHCQLKACHNVAPCAATYWAGDSAATGRPTSYGAARLRRRRYVHNLGAQPASKIATLALAEPIQTVTKAKKMTSVHHHSKIEGPKRKIQWCLLQKNGTGKRLTSLSLCKVIFSHLISVSPHGKQHAIHSCAAQRDRSKTTN